MNGRNTYYQDWRQQNPEQAAKIFQVLCHNCNMSKGFYGYCPHEKERENEIKT